MLSALLKKRHPGEKRSSGERRTGGDRATSGTKKQIGETRISHDVVAEAGVAIRNTDSGTATRIGNPGGKMNGAVRVRRAVAAGVMTMIDGRMTMIVGSGTTDAAESLPVRGGIHPILSKISSMRDQPISSTRDQPISSMRDTAKMAALLLPDLRIGREPTWTISWIICLLAQSQGQILRPHGQDRVICLPRQEGRGHPQG
mmetsp:Transcript_53291/g.93550  ORF Transcript_53291/g.93550 Transcript_53291/m.93550 type:complete len:201 (+) Transcript_53291:175-777(+)